MARIDSAADSGETELQNLPRIDFHYCLCGCEISQAKMWELGKWVSGRTVDYDPPLSRSLCTLIEYSSLYCRAGVWALWGRDFKFFARIHLWAQYLITLQAQKILNPEPSPKALTIFPQKKLQSYLLDSKGPNRFRIKRLSLRVWYIEKIGRSLNKSRKFKRLNYFFLWV